MKAGGLLPPVDAFLDIGKVGTNLMSSGLDYG
jgi:hypothetical protein